MYKDRTATVAKSDEHRASFRVALAELRNALHLKDCELASAIEARIDQIITDWERDDATS